MIRVVGIDPGLSGAFAVLDLHQGGAILHVTSVTRTPILTVTVRSRTRRDYDVPGMWRLITDAIAPLATTVALVTIERQGPRPQEGVVSSFRTGFGFGLWRAIAVAAGVPVYLVTPQVWRREYGLLGAGKHAAIRAAMDRFPDYPPAFTRHDGAADAMLIAAWGARHRVASAGSDSADAVAPPAPAAPPASPAATDTARGALPSG
jgi:crossover junction endodeoxyribonuclease RuvC